MRWRPATILWYGRGVDLAAPFAIILAGGANRRFWPLAQKSLLRFGDESLLDRHVSTLARAGFDDVVVVGNPANEARLRTLPAEGARVHVVVQPSPLGMGDAVLQCESLVRSQLAGRSMLVSQVHDLIDPAIFRQLAARLSEEDADGFVVGRRVSSYFPGGYLVIDDGRARDVIEKPPPGQEPSDLMKIVADVVRDPAAFFDALRAVAPDPADHYERALGRLMAEQTIRVHDYGGAWVPIKYPWHLLDAVLNIIGRLPDDLAGRHAAAYADSGRLAMPDARVETGARIEGQVALGAGVRVMAGATISGDVILGAGVQVRPGASIVGPAEIGANSTVRENVVVRGARLGPGCSINPGATIAQAILGRESIVGNGALVRESILGAGCVAGFGTEIARSYIGEDCWFHTNYIGDSVIGDDVSFGSGTTTANLRLDERTIRVTVDGAPIDTGMSKLGAMIGAHVRVGINVSLMPGVRIGTQSVVGPAVLLQRDLPDGQMARRPAELEIVPNPIAIDRASRAAFRDSLGRPG